MNTDGARGEGRNNRFDMETAGRSCRRGWLSLRGKAYLALGEIEKAEADFKAAKEQS